MSPTPTVCSIRFPEDRYHAPRMPHVWSPPAWDKEGCEHVRRADAANAKAAKLERAKRAKRAEQEAAARRAQIILTEEPRFAPCIRCRGRDGPTCAYFTLREYLKLSKPMQDYVRRRGQPVKWDPAQTGTAADCAVFGNVEYTMVLH